MDMIMDRQIERRSVRYSLYTDNGTKKLDFNVEDCSCQEAGKLALQYMKDHEIETATFKEEDIYIGEDEWQTVDAFELKN